MKSDRKEGRHSKPKLLYRFRKYNRTCNTTQGGPDPNAPLTTNKGNPVRMKVNGQDHGLDNEVIVEPNGEGFITGYVKNDGEILNIEAVDKFIEYIEDMILTVAK